MPHSDGFGDGGNGDRAWAPESDACSAAAKEQLERILATPPFKSGRNCPAFLRFVVGSGANEAWQAMMSNAPVQPHRECI